MLDQHSITVTTAVPVEAPQPPAQLAAEVARLGANQILFHSGDYLVLVARAAQIPSVLREIGRLRELSFRAVGEGTGKALDLDAFDENYMHLFVWEQRAQQILGAYRMGMSDVILRQKGVAGLYSSSLFHYDESFFGELGCALEMGRSFVRAECQRTRVLAYLWRGIGRLIALRPRYSILFGPVSISSSYSSAARCLIAEQLSRGAYRHPLSSKVRARRPLALPETQSALPALDVKQLSKRVAALEPSGEGLPVLVREYLKLGGRFLSFSIDPDFTNALDGLVAVDLARTEPRLLSLYMGQDAYDLFTATSSRATPRLQLAG